MISQTVGRWLRSASRSFLPFCRRLTRCPFYQPCALALRAGLSPARENPADRRSPQRDDPGRAAKKAAQAAAPPPGNAPPATLPPEEPGAGGRDPRPDGTPHERARWQTPERARTLSRRGISAGGGGAPGGAAEGGRPHKGRIQNRPENRERPNPARPGLLHRGERNAGQRREETHPPSQASGLRRSRPTRGVGDERRPRRRSPLAFGRVAIAAHVGGHRSRLVGSQLLDNSDSITSW